MKHLEQLFEDLNVEVFNPAGLNLLWPRKVAFLFVSMIFTLLLQRSILIRFSISWRLSTMYVKEFAFGTHPLTLLSFAVIVWPIVRSFTWVSLSFFSSRTFMLMLLWPHTYPTILKRLPTPVSITFLCWSACNVAVVDSIGGSANDFR